MAYFLTKHASDRKRQMNLDEKTIADLVYRPGVVTRCKSRTDPNRLIYLLRCGELSAFADRTQSGDWKIITIVPATEEAWRKFYPEERDGRFIKPELWNK